MTKKATTGAKFMTVSGGLNPITVGTVPLGELSFRRENYRKMNEKQKATLRASTDSLGFQSFLVVVKESDGTYGIVDGHHRRDELEAKGATEAPVILLPEGTDPRKADMGMFSFNVSAEVQDEKFASLVLQMLEDGADAEQLRLHAGISEDFMKSVQEALKEPSPELGGEDDLPREGNDGGPGPKGPKAPKVKIVLVLQRDAEGSASPVAFTMTGEKTIISREVREALEAQNLVLEELEPLWFQSGEDLPMILDSVLSEDEGEDEGP